MTLQQELKSWFSPTPSTVAIVPEPKIGEKAPSDEKLKMPPGDGKPVLVAFLRHCGCPFAEKTFRQLQALAEKYPDTLTTIAISHSSPEDTQTWLTSLGGARNVQVINDPDRDIYARWGLGTSSAWHVLNPSSMFQVWKLGRQEGIWNRPTESGSRWVRDGVWGVDGEGTVRWGGGSTNASAVLEREWEGIGRALGLEG